MKLIFYLLFLCYLVIISNSCPNFPKPIEINQNDPLLVKAYSEVDSMIQENMQTYGIKSFMATIVYKDKIVWSKAYGKKNPLDPNSPDLTIDNTVRIASITKVFTDVTMFQLRDKGIVQLDDPVTKYYPNFSVRDPYNTKKEITLRQLSSHQSGLAREIPCDWTLLPTKNCSEEIILKRLEEQFLILPVYTQTHYSNLGIALLGRTLGKAAESEYEKYVEEKILHPLGMKNSTFNYTKIQDIMATGLILNNGTYYEADIIDLGWGRPMGGLFSTARDMSQFIMFWLNGDDDILDSSTVREALSPIALINDGVSAYGTPFEMHYDSDNTVWMKSKAGLLDGYRSQLALVKELKIGIFFSALLTMETEDLFTRQAMEILMPVYEALLYRENDKPENKETSANDLLKPIPSRLGKNKPKQIPLSEFVGVYEFTYGMFALSNCSSTTELIGSLGDGVLYNVTKFHEDYPEILRIQFASPSILSCMDVDDGYDFELAYFKLDKNEVQVMGQTMYKNQTKSLEVEKYLYLKNSQKFSFK